MPKGSTALELDDLRGGYEAHKRKDQKAEGLSRTPRGAEGQSALWQIL